VKLLLQLAPAGAVEPAVKRRLSRDTGKNCANEPCSHVAAWHPGAHIRLFVDGRRRDLGPRSLHIAGHAAAHPG
jgi:hypothetical protein